MFRLFLRLVLLWAVADALFTLNLDEDSVIFWELDYEGEEFTVEVHTKATERTGWVGVGFSDNGNLSDGSADFCVAWRNHLVGSEAPFQITDVHVPSGTVLLKQDAQQDCLAFQYLRHNNTIKWTFKRKFVTCDIFDYALEEGTTHLHWIKGDGPLYDIKGVSLASAASSADFKRVRFLKNENPLPPVSSRTAESIDVLNAKVEVPPVETTYWCHVVKLPETFKEKHHVVQFEAIIQQGNEELVHHMEVFHCEAPVDVEMKAYSGPCDRSPPEISVCSRVIGAWAMGAEPLRYPAEAGFPVGGPEFNLYVRLEMHYNNPGLRAGVVDSSGMRFWITRNLRKYDAGVMELGLEYTDKMAIPPAYRNFQLTGICNHECTSVGLPPEGITVFASQLHTHLTGTRVVTRHFRPTKSGRWGGFVELPRMNFDNHYSTHYQEIRQLKNPTRVLPGDILLTSCEYDTTNRTEITLGGFAISEEMCVNYIHYYPRSQLEVCKSSVSWRSLRNYFRFVSTMDGQKIEPEGPVSANYKGIKWTPFRSRLLADFYNGSPIDMQCNRSDGSRFPGSWDSMPLVALPALEPRPHPNEECVTAGLTSVEAQTFEKE